MISQHEREERTCMDGVKSFQDKLNEQEAKLQAAEDRAMEERDKRKRAEDQIEYLKSRVAVSKQRLQDTDIEEVPGPLNHLKQHISDQRKEIDRLKQIVEARDLTIKELNEELAENWQ